MESRQDQLVVIKNAVTAELCLKLLNEFDDGINQKLLNAVDDYESLKLIYSDQWQEIVFQSVAVKVGDPLAVQYISRSEGSLDWHADREFFGCDVVCIWLALEEIERGVEFKNETVGGDLGSGDVIFFGGDVIHRSAKLAPNRTRKSIVVHYKIEVNG